MNEKMQEKKCIVRYNEELKKMNEKMQEKKCIVRYNDGEEGHIIFKLSSDDDINRIKGGRLLVSFGGLYTYYVDTLTENYKEWFNGGQLCINGGQDLSITNMKEVIDFILNNRYEIEAKLRGRFYDDKPPKELIF